MLFILPQFACYTSQLREGNLTGRQLLNTSTRIGHNDNYISTDLLHFPPEVLLLLIDVMHTNIDQYSVKSIENVTIAGKEIKREDFVEDIREYIANKSTIILVSLIIMIEKLI